MPEAQFPPPVRAAHPLIAVCEAPARGTADSTGLRVAAVRCKTNFSFLEGASHGDELVTQAAALGYTAIAITDRESLAGVVRAHVAAKKVGIKLLVGAEIHPVDAPKLVLWATDRTSYGRLCRLLTHGRTRGSKQDGCRITAADIAAHSAGLLAGLPLLELLQNDDQQTDNAVAATAVFREAFGDRLYGLAELHRGPQDRLLLQRMAELVDTLGIPLTAADDVLYHEPERRRLQAVLTAIRLGKPVAEIVPHLPVNGEHALRPLVDLQQLYADYPAALQRTQELADRCHFNLDELRYEYPEELIPRGKTAAGYLTELTRRGASIRYPNGVPKKVQRVLAHELALIHKLQYEAYFLTVYDLVRFARSRKILCQGRGSAANSAVCYCLQVTEVDPDQHDLLFERFISEERNEAPDIDVDFEHERREEVLQYLYQKYGRHRAGLAATVVTYRARSAIRDVGKALGLSLDQVGSLAKNVGRYHIEGDVNERFQEAGFDAGSRIGKQLIYFVKQILGFPRHLSQHVGGMVMTRGRLDEFCVIENAAMPDRTIVQWDKNDLEALGILKVDILALGMLTAIRKCLMLVNQQSSHFHVKPLTLAGIPQEDATVYHMIQQADTIGVFQIESRAQMSMLPRLKPKTFYDLVIEVAIVRPGPIQGDMVHPYLRRRDGLEEVTYPGKDIENVLSRTLGVPIFQEQAMKLASVAAGFTPGEADEFRRAMAAWRSGGRIDEFEDRLKQGMQKKGYTGEFADRLFSQIRGFGEYGFPESHAASFAILVYFSCWLKCYHPAAFCTALLNSQPMGFYSPSQLVSDARAHRVEVRPVCVNASHRDCTLELLENPTRPQTGTQTQRDESAVRLGFRMIRGLRDQHVDQLLTARGSQPFRDFDELARRTSLPSAALDRLAAADAMRSLRLDRRQARWEALPSNTAAPLLNRADQSEPAVDLPVLPPQANIAADYRHTGLSLQGHPLQFARGTLAQLNVHTTAALTHLQDGCRVKVAGVVLLRQRPGTAKGVTFMTIEDETGTANLIVWPDVWEKFRKVAHTAVAILVRGKLQKDATGLVIHIVVDHLADINDTIENTTVRSRNFH